MPIYIYKAKTPQGGVVTDKVEADNERIVAAKLRAQHLTLMSIQPEKKKGDISFPMPKFFKKKTKVSVKDLAIFSRQFSTMINAGVPVLQSLNIIIDQVENQGFKDVIKKIKDDISQGSTLSDAIAKYPNVFSGLYINMIKAGEAGGLLDTILQRLSSYLEQADSLKRKVKSAMTYPLVVSTIAVSVVIFLLAFVIPTFKDVFSSFGGKLPLPTQILVTISETVRKFILFIVGGAIVFIVTFIRLIKTTKGQHIWHRVQLKIPVFGMLLKKVAVSKFTRTLGTLVRSGVPIVQALDIVAKTAGNTVVEGAIIKAKNSIKDGESITAPIKESGIFPPMVVQMISVGEETGAMDEMLIRVADFYDDEVETAIEGLTSMIEPLLIVFMGVTIGAIVVAMFMPMFEMGGLVGG